MKKQLEECLDSGFYSIGKRLTSEEDAAHHAVDTFHEHKKRNIYCYFSCGGPMHPAPPKIVKPIYEKTGVFILAAAACEIENYEDVWCSVYNAVASRHLTRGHWHRGVIPRIGKLRDLVKYCSNYVPWDDVEAAVAKYAPDGNTAACAADAPEGTKAEWELEMELRDLLAGERKK